jgi:hypothetical protein
MRLSDAPARLDRIPTRPAGTLMPKQKCTAAAAPPSPRHRLPPADPHNRKKIAHGMSNPCLAVRRCHERGYETLPERRREPMRFMLIVKGNEDTEAGVMPSEADLTAMGNFNEEMVKAGIMKGGEGLHPSRRGARVKFKGKQTSVVDGPFAEAKELVAGFWIIDVPSLADAVAWARRVPSPDGNESEIEVRQVFEAADFGKEFTPELRAQEDRMRDEIEKQSKH